MQRITNVFSPEFGQLDAQTHEGHTNTHKKGRFFFLLVFGHNRGSPGRVLHHDMRATNKTTLMILSRALNEARSYSLRIGGRKIRTLIYYAWFGCFLRLSVKMETKQSPI